MNKQYRGRYPIGTKSEWLPEEEVRNNSTSLQLDVIHVPWETYKDNDCRPRSAAPLSEGKRDHKLRRNQALQEFPIGTKVSRSFAGADGVSLSVAGRVHDFQALYWRVRCPDGDWEELSGRGMTCGIKEW